MKFFLPAADSPQQAEEVYGKIKAFVVEQMGWVRDERYYSLHFRHNGRDHMATVGNEDPLTHELVIAIFRSHMESGPFYICTPNRGVLRGEPILASGNSSGVLFET